MLREWPRFINLIRFLIRILFLFLLIFLIFKTIFVNKYILSLMVEWNIIKFISSQIDQKETLEMLNYNKVFHIWYFLYTHASYVEIEFIIEGQTSVVE